MGSRRVATAAASATFAECLGALLQPWPVVATHNMHAPTSCPGGHGGASATRGARPLNLSLLIGQL
eukprot:366472-Chlamydomonas_euryale.AAC.15